MAKAYGGAPNELPDLGVPAAEIGSAGPVRVLAAASNARWVALCQGEPQEARLFVGERAGERFERLLAHDVTGRYVALEAGSQAWLIDTYGSNRFSLSDAGADVRRARADFAPHRSLSFDAQGEHLAYLRRGTAGTEIVVRRLSDGTEHSCSAGPGDIYSLRIAADASLVSFEALRRDSNGNGKLDWPAPEDTAPACAPHSLRFRAYADRADAPVRGICKLGEAFARDVPELVYPLGDALLTRRVNGDLTLSAGSGLSSMAPAACNGRVLFAEEARQLLLVACELPKKPGKREVWLTGPTLAKNLKVEVAATEVDRQPVRNARLVPLYPGAESTLLDLDTRELIPLEAGTRVLAVDGADALLWRGDEIWTISADTKRKQRLASGVVAVPSFLASDHYVLLSPFLVTRPSGPSFELTDEAHLALSSTGHVLTGATAPRADGSIQGPLRWRDARVPSLDGSADRPGVSRPNLPTDRP